MTLRIFVIFSIFFRYVSADFLVSDFKNFLFSSSGMDVSESLGALLNTSYIEKNQLYFSFEENIEEIFEKIGTPPEIISGGVVGKSALFTSHASFLKYQKSMPRFFYSSSSIPDFVVNFYVLPVKLMGKQTLFRKFLNRKSSIGEEINNIHLFLDGPFLILEIEENLLGKAKKSRKKSLNMVQINVWQKISIFYQKKEKQVLLYLDDKEVIKMSISLQWILDEKDIATMYFGGGFTGSLDEFYLTSGSKFVKESLTSEGASYVSKVISLRGRDEVIFRAKMLSQRIDSRKIKIFLKKSSFIFEELDESIPWVLLPSSGVINEVSKNPDRFFQFRIDLSSIEVGEELFRIESIYFETVPKVIASPEIFRIFPTVGSAKVVWKNPLDPLVKKIWFYISKDGFRRHLFKFGGLVEDFKRDPDGNVSATIYGLVEGQEYQIFARFQGNLADHLSSPSQSMNVIPNREEPLP